MKNIKKIISVVIVTIMMSLLLTSCTTDEISFINAMEKFANVTSYEATSEISTVINAEMPEYMTGYNNWPSVKSVLNSLKNFKLVSKASLSEKKDNVLMKAELGVVSDDFMFNTTLYAKSEGNSFVETIKIPTTLRWMLPEKNMNAEYLTIDFDEFNEFMAEQQNIGAVSAMPFSISPKNIIPESKNLNAAFLKFQAEYAKKMGMSPKIITKIGNKFTLKFTDESLKLFAKAVVDTYLQNMDARKDVEAFIKDIITFYDSIYPGIIPTETKDEIYASLTTFEELQEQVNEFFTALEKLPLLGSKGVEINYMTDTRGLITKIDGFVDLLIDVNAIDALQYGEAFEDEAYSFNILINFKQEYSKINQPVSVDFPKLTKENNASYIGIIKDLVEGSTSNADMVFSPTRERPQPELPAADGSISVVHYGNLLNFEDTKPEIINSTLYVPLDKMSNEFYFDYRWDVDKNCAVINRDGIDLDVYIDDSVLYGEDYSIVLSAEAIDLNGQVYVPFRSFMKAFFGYYNVEWDAEKNAAIVGYAEW